MYGTQSIRQAGSTLSLILRNDTHHSKCPSASIRCARFASGSVNSRPSPANTQHGIEARAHNTRLWRLAYLPPHGLICPPSSYDSFILRTSHSKISICAPQQGVNTTTSRYSRPSPPLPPPPSRTKRSIQGEAHREHRHQQGLYICTNIDFSLLGTKPF